MIILVYSNYLFLPGAFSEKSYLKVKNNHGYMFSGIHWVNNNIPENSKVIIINRPIANFKNFAVSGGFNYFTNSKEANYYKKQEYEEIKKDNKILFYLSKNGLCMYGPAPCSHFMIEQLNVKKKFGYNIYWIKNKN